MVIVTVLSVRVPSSFHDQSGSVAWLPDHDREDLGARELEIEDGAACCPEVAEPVGQFGAENRRGGRCDG